MSLTQQANKILTKVRTDFERSGIPPFVTADILQRRPYMVVKLEHPTGRFGVGVSKCAPCDTFDEAVGFKLAMKRAVEEYVHGKALLLEFAV